MRKIRLFAVLALALAVSGVATAQNRQVRGKVVDARTGEALTGAVVMSTRTNAAAVVSTTGAFQLAIPAGEQELRFSFLGYKEKGITVQAGVTDLGTVEMESSTFGMEEVIITAGLVVNDRATPVAVSNIPLEIIENKLSSQEFPEILKSTPSVYATKQNGGYGDSRIALRGFDSNNIGVLINGVPVNDMESGKVYWSNWGGLSDVTSMMQVQRGLGASKLALSSVGGTINIVTKSIDAQQGGGIYYGIGNDGLQKMQMNISTGLMENGWAITLAGGHAQSNGYVLGTDYEAWNYFVNIAKQLPKGHRLSLSAFGAPQWHNQRATMYPIADYRNSPDGIRMNRSYGYVNDAVMGTAYGYNVYHKPQISLMHYWTINEKSSLSTSVYASLATGGGRRARGNSSLITVSNTTGQPAGTLYNGYGQIDWDKIYATNRERSALGLSSEVVFSNAVNSHDWYGVLSTYTNQLTDEIKLTAGFDGRYYRGYHREELTDLLGGSFFNDPTAMYGRNQTELHVGDVVNYDEIGEVLWAGGFAQGEYVLDNFSAFLSATLSSNSYRWSNFGAEPIDGRQVSDWIGFLPWSVKGGVNYKFFDNHNIFVNGGYFTRSPYLNISFLNYTIRPNKDVKYERITTAEAGYGFANSFLNISATGYYTLWLDRGVTRSYGGTLYNIPGLNARHMGIELEATYRPFKDLDIKGMFSLGDWILRDDVQFIAYDENQQKIGEYKAFISGVHVGNAAQMTAALGVNWKPFKDWRLGLDFNWFGKNFADFDAANRTQIQDKVDSWQMPDYYTIDLSASYKFNIGKQSLTLYGNINNILNAEYIADAKDGTMHDAASALVYYGFGRTWTFGIKLNF